MNGRWRVAPRGTGSAGPAVARPPRRRWEATQWNGPVLTLERRSVGRLGPDLLADDVEVSDVVASVRRTSPSRLLGEALVDQRLVAGIGNAWLAETLWNARVSPWRRLEDVSEEELERSSLGLGSRCEPRFAGSGVDVRSIGAQEAVPALRDADRVARARRDRNRTAYWCPRCQPTSAEGRELNPRGACTPNVFEAAVRLSAFED